MDNVEFFLMLIKKKWYYSSDRSPKAMENFHYCRRTHRTTERASSRINLLVKMRLFSPTLFNLSLKKTSVFPALFFLLLILFS